VWVYSDVTYEIRKMSNLERCWEVGMEPISLVVKKGRLRWFGHSRLLEYIYLLAYLLVLFLH